MKLCVPMEKYDAFKEVIDLVSSSEESVAHSVIYALYEYKAMLLAAPASAVIVNIIKNHFDNEGQKKYESFAGQIGDALAEYLMQDKASRKIHLIDDWIKEAESELKCFEAILRIGKFLTERGVENG